MIKLENFIITPNAEKTKVKFNAHTREESDHSKIARGALDVLCRDDKEWINMNQWRTALPTATQNLDSADYLIAFAQHPLYGSEYYVFGGLFEVEKIEPEITDGYGYKLILMDEYKEYIKRLIIKVKRPIGQMITRNYKDLQQQEVNPEVYEILKPLQ